MRTTEDQIADVEGEVRTYARAKLCKLLAEESLSYTECKAALDEYDWTDVYPEIDADGDLTGRILELEDGYEIVGVSDDGTIFRGEGCCDAIIDSDLLEPSDEDNDD